LPDEPIRSSLHLPTALACLALQILFIGMCLYHNVGIHDYVGTLSTISFGSIYLATQSLIWIIASSRSLQWGASLAELWGKARLTVMMALLCLVSVAAVIASPHLSDRLLSLSNPVSLSADGTQLKLGGSIPSNLAADVESICANGACVAARTIILNSDGGSFDGAMAGMQALKAAGIRRAVVVGNCLSACVALWAGFTDATIQPGSAIGIQGIYDPLSGQRTVESKKQTEQLSKLLQTRGFPRKIVDTALSYPSTEYYYMSGAEMELLLHSTQP
jgi:hypothetical protein